MTFAGTLTDNVSNPTQYGFMDAYASFRSQITWSLTVTGPINQTSLPQCYTSGVVSASVSASGQITAKPTPIGANDGAQACSGTISPAPGAWPSAADGWITGSTNFIAGSNWYAAVNPTPPDRNSGEGLMDSDTNFGADLCSYEAGKAFVGPGLNAPYFSVSGNPPDPNYNGTSASGSFEYPQLTNNIGGGINSPNGALIGPTTKTWSFSDTGSDGFGGTDTASGSDTLSYSISTSCCPGVSAALSGVRAAARPASGGCPALRVATLPRSGLFPVKETGFKFSLGVVADGGCPPYLYLWSVGVMNKPKSVGIKWSSTTSDLPVVTLTCPPPASQEQCRGRIRFDVTVTDKSKQRGQGNVLIDWQPSIPLTTFWRHRYSDRLRIVADQLVGLNRQAALGISEGTMTRSIPIVTNVKDTVDNGNQASKIAPLQLQRDRLQQLLAQDPPASDLGAIALPLVVPRPSKAALCGRVSVRYAGVAERACARVTPDTRALVAAAADADSALSAAITTENRWAAASRAGNDTMATLQLIASRLLQIELADAFVAEDRADLRLAKAEQTQGITPAVVTKAQLIQAIALLRRRSRFPPPIASQLGPSETPAVLASQLRAFVGKMRGSTIDLAAVLSRAISTDTPPQGEDRVTAAQLRAVVAALDGQGAISQQHARELDNALRNSGPAALAAFRGTAAHLPGSAGAFLRAGAQALAGY